MSRSRTAARARSRTAAFTLDGEVASPARLTVGDLRTRWRQRRADVVFHCLKAGPQPHSFSGPLLRDVVADAGPVFGGPGRKARAGFVLAVDGGDGHGTVLSWAEIDADFGNVPVLLATDMDGRGLEAEGAQLVVPSDHCGARYVSAVTAVRLTGWPRVAALMARELPAAAAPRTGRRAAAVSGDGE
ncbi:molybdopterin-dependent oxidoreductase [Streptomyces tremellae]|uniref:Oxidoreductase molybdopterin-binding domain-containing protein n=1 Tax=Streptomyces tremellae TaxID=1124239 RepID=A0ABP7F8U8_9ACTN